MSNADTHGSPEISTSVVACDTCHNQGEIWSGEMAYQGHLQPPEPVMVECPECTGESVQLRTGAQ